MDATDNHLARARHLNNLNRFDAARQEVEQALAFDPINAEALQYLSIVCYNTNDYKGGLAAAQHLLGGQLRRTVAFFTRQAWHPTHNAPTRTSACWA